METTTQTENQNLVDEADRTRFCNELNQNFSVIAPAGVGKTKAITNRIVKLTLEGTEGLEPIDTSKLVVVTYTQKAANEMQKRVRQALMKNPMTSTCALGALNKAFFGTIHSFCLNLLKGYGHHLGLPNKFQLVRNDDALWLDFIKKSHKFSELIQGALAQSILKYQPLDKVLILSRQTNPNTLKNNNLPLCPEIDISSILEYKPKKCAAKFEEKKVLLRKWYETLRSNLLPINLPAFNKGPSEFKEICAEVFSPLWHWLGKASLNLAIDIAKAYQAFRLSKGLINYEDMVSLALKLVQDQEAGKVIREQSYRVILDEAQDTDKEQFAILLGVTSKEVTETETPAPGHFCMVGDPQQSIYSSRADLPTYLKIHENLTTKGIANSLIFSVTMRCDIQVVKHVNAVFPHILNSQTTRNQVNFVPLIPRPSAHEGNVLKLTIPTQEKGDPIFQESEFIAEWLQRQTLKKLGIDRWSRLAILCPRKTWLTPIAKALAHLGIPNQVHSREDTAAHNPAYAWLSALCTIMAFPSDSFEIAGVLRELFGISDDTIAEYVQWVRKDKKERIVNRHPLNLVAPTENKGLVAEKLNTMYAIRAKILQLPLRDAVHLLALEFHLTARLNALPGYSATELRALLEKLLTDAILAEQEHLSLAEFALQLQEGLPKLLEEVALQHDAVQLCTCHKSKGLEWDVIMVPFLFRSICFPRDPYPQLGPASSNKPLKVAVCSHPAKEVIDKEKAYKRHTELQRLLYVTATRARNTLIWLDDEMLFNSPQGSLAEHLRFLPNATNRSEWDDLPKKVTSALTCSFPTSTPVALSKSVNVPVLNLENAYKNARNYPQMRRPSNKKKSDTVLLANTRAQSVALKQDEIEAVSYGNWWHKIMETLKWNEVSSNHKAFALEKLRSCPIPHRGKQELAAFFDSETYALLAAPNVNVKTEIPFLWKDKNTIYEGIIDLLAWDSIREIYVLIDWKTDNIEASNLDFLLTRYGPQLTIYGKTIQANTQILPHVFIYSTFLAQKISV